MDDESAEIELLEQNLNKTRQISQRMTSILSSFDTRLVKLEKSILPLYTSTQILNRRASNIDKALLKIDDIASNQEGIAAEEALILRGPQPGQLNIYIDALERLNASIAFKSSDRDSRDTAHLVETGAKKLTQQYTMLVAEASSGSAAAPTPASPSLRPLVQSLRALPLPATHPSHAAASAIQATLAEAQRGYADMRGNWARKGLEQSARRVLEQADTARDGVGAGREFGIWVESLLDVAEAEYTLLLDLAPLPTQSLLASTYSTFLVPLLGLFSNTLASLTTLIKRALHTHTFLALSAHAALSGLNSRWDTLVARRAEARRDADELKEGLHALRAVCLRSFPEFLADLKMAGFGKGGDISTGIADFAISTVEYLERIPEVQDAVGSALLTLGDGNWKMGEGVKVGKGIQLGEGAESIVVEHYMYDAVTTLINSLTTLSRTQRRPAFGSMFLLNNMAFLRLRLLLEPGRLVLPTPAHDALQSNFRTAKAAYFDANFSPLMQALTDDPRERGGRQATKERFTRFFDLLEEVAERHRMAKVLEDDAMSRDAVVEEVVKLVVPSLQRFTQKNREKEFSKNPQKYIKMSAEEVETQIRSFYR